jgi:hypothetical protein
MNSQVLYKLGAFVLLTKYYLGDQIKNKIGWACSTHPGFWWGNLGKRDHLEDIGIDGRKILTWILKKWLQGSGPD